MIDVSKLPNRILNDIQENTDKRRSEIAQMSVEEAFEAYCQWNGIVGYGSQLIEALDLIRAAEIKK